MFDGFAQLFFVVVLLVIPTDTTCVIKKIVENPDFIFLHVGKTGGSTISRALKHATSFSFSEYHVCSPTKEEIGEKRVLFSIRDPISRSFSVWQWRKYWCTVKNARCDDPNEQKLFECFPTFSDFLEAKGKPNSNPQIHSSGISSKSNEGNCDQFAKTEFLFHWDMNLQWYLQNFDAKFVANHVFPVRQSHMEEDFIAFCHFLSFNEDQCSLGAKFLAKFRINSEYSKNQEDRVLSPRAWEILNATLKSEITLYHKLVKNQKLLRSQ